MYPYLFLENDQYIYFPLSLPPPPLPATPLNPFNPFNPFLTANTSHFAARYNLLYIYIDLYSLPSSPPLQHSLCMCIYILRNL